MKMPKLAMPLTVFKIQNAKPKAKKLIHSLMDWVSTLKFNLMVKKSGVFSISNPLI